MRRVAYKLKHIRRKFDLKQNVVEHLRSKQRIIHATSHTKHIIKFVKIFQSSPSSNFIQTMSSPPIILITKSNQKPNA